MNIIIENYEIMFLKNSSIPIIFAINGNFGNLAKHKDLINSLKGHPYIVSNMAAIKTYCNKMGIYDIDYYTINEKMRAIYDDNMMRELYYRHKLNNNNSVRNNISVENNSINENNKIYI